MSLDNSPAITMGLPMGHSLTMVMGRVPPILCDAGEILPPGNAAFWELERRALEIYRRKRREAQIKMEERQTKTLMMNNPIEGECDGVGAILSCTGTKSRRRRSDFKGRRWEFSSGFCIFLNFWENLFFQNPGTSYMIDHRRKRRRKRNQNVQAGME